MGSKASRNTSIEALRLVAVAGIAIFHTFQWTFQAVCTGLPEYAPLAVFPYSGALGFINLLGCWANEVFFMISGYFLIPSAIRALQNGSSAQDLTLKSLERLKRAPFVVALLVLATFGINCYIAATANEAAGIVLWRKLMSAVTYLVAFIAAGEMRFVLECHGNASGAQKSKNVLIGLVAVTIALELLLSANSQYDALWKLSYKSTSVISFILAAASVAAAALHQPRHEVPAVNKTIMPLAAGTLAFYAVQSFTCNVWRPIFDNAIYTMATGIQTGEPRPAAAILLGILMSLCLALALLLMDIVRRAVVGTIKAHMNS